MPPEPLERFGTSVLISELQARGVLTHHEAGLLLDGRDIGDAYILRRQSQRAAEIRALILRGDLSEALIEISRMHPELSGLQHLAERRGLITHGV